MTKFQMTFLISFTLIMVAAWAAVWAVAYANVQEVQVRTFESSTTLEVKPNYGEQKTAPGTLLQGSDYCLQNCR